MRKLTLFLLSLCLLATPALAQRVQPAGTQPRLLIDLPTAGTLPRGTFDVGLRMYPKGGVIFGIGVGMSDHFMFGVSYGGENIIGEGKVNWNPDPAVQVRLRILDEDLVFPAITLGFDSQGYGAYRDDLKRYTIKSRGLFASASKNYRFIGDLGLHGGVNYSFENDDGDRDLNFFGGINLALTPELSLLGEYDFALNDNSARAIGEGKGYLNLGVRWLFGRHLSLEAALKNVLQNKAHVASANREVKIGYVERF